MKLFRNVIVYLLITMFIAAGCSQVKQEDAQADPGTEIHLTEQIQGEFIGYADGDQVIISHNGEEEYYLISSNVVGDLEIVEVGDLIYFSFETSEEGRLVLQTLRLGN